MVNNKYSNYRILNRTEISRNNFIKSSNSIKNNPKINACVNAVWEHFGFKNTLFGHTETDTFQAIKESENHFGVILYSDINGNNAYDDEVLNAGKNCPHCAKRNCKVIMGVTKTNHQSFTPLNKGESGKYNYDSIRTDLNPTTSDIHFIIANRQEMIESCKTSFPSGVKSKAFRQLSEMIYMSLDLADRQIWKPAGFTYGVKGHILALDPHGNVVKDTAPTYGTKYSTWQADKRERRAGQSFTIVFERRVPI